MVFYIDKGEVRCGCSLILMGEVRGGCSLILKDEVYKRLLFVDIDGESKM